MQLMSLVTIFWMMFKMRKDVEGDVPNIETSSRGWAVLLIHKNVSFCWGEIFCCRLMQLSWLYVCAGRIGFHSWCRTAWKKPLFPVVYDARMYNAGFLSKNEQECVFVALNSTIFSGPLFRIWLISCVRMYGDGVLWSWIVEWSGTMDRMNMKGDR